MLSYLRIFFVKNSDIERGFFLTPYIIIDRQEIQQIYTIYQGESTLFRK